VRCETDGAAAVYWQHPSVKDGGGEGFKRATEFDVEYTHSVTLPLTKGVDNAGYAWKAQDGSIAAFTAEAAAAAAIIARAVFDIARNVWMRGPQQFIPNTDF
jgi:hypothetical protein